MSDLRSIIIDLPKDEVASRVKKLLKPAPTERNWDCFWCGRVEDGRIDLMYHNGGMHWNGNKIRARFTGKLEALSENKTRISYSLGLSNSFIQFSLVWLGLVCSLCVVAAWAGNQFEWVDESIRNLWIYLPLATIPCAILFTWKNFWLTRNQPVEWIKSVFRKELEKVEMNLASTQENEIQSHHDDTLNISETHAGI